MNRLRPLFQSSIRRSLTFVLLLVALLPLAALFLFNRFSVQPQMTRQPSQTYYMAMEQAASFVSDKAGLARSLVNMLCGDASVQSQISFREMQTNDYDGAWLADVGDRRVYYKGYLLGAVSRAYLFLNGEGASFQDVGIYPQLTREQRQEFDAWLQDESASNLFLTLTEEQLGRKPQYVYLVAKVPSMQVLGVRFGLIQADISLSVFDTILHEAPASENSALYLLNGSGQVIVQSGQPPAADLALDELCAQLQAGGEAHNLTPIQLEGKSYLAGSSRVSGTDWQVVMVMPYSDVVGVTRQVNQVLLLTVIALVLVILPLTGVFVRFYSRPILSLKQGANAVAEGDYSVDIPHSGSLEFDQVIDSFNFMTKRTKEMMARQYEMGQALKSAELQVLQEQINPHFLYNTLDLLHWQARRAGARDIEDVVYALSEFYKLSLGQGEEIVSLEHELRHVSAYVRIQNVRFMNKIQLSVDVPEEIRACAIPKIVLQPLVENSIQHGIREKEDESGIIAITARRWGDEILLRVMDDGVGMDEETLAEILSGKRGDSYGIHNVNDRLILYYGQDARLQYESKPGHGTIVTLRIPWVAH